MTFFYRINTIIIMSDIFKITKKQEINKNRLSELLFNVNAVLVYKKTIFPNKNILLFEINLSSVDLGNVILIYHEMTYFVWTILKHDIYIKNRIFKKLQHLLQKKIFATLQHHFFLSFPQKYFYTPPIIFCWIYENLIAETFHFQKNHLLIMK